MKSNDFLSEDIASDAHDMHLDHEVQMARKDCYAAADDAIALHKLLRNVSEQQGLEGWVAAKITLASDYLNTVREHLEYQLMSQVQPEAMELPVAEGAMPASVIKVKEKIRLMSDAEKKDYFKGKSKEQLQKMARSHGYGENSNVYAQHATEEVSEAKGLHKRVRIVKGPDAGKTGYIRQIEHGQYKGAPKKFDVDIEGGGQANGLPATALRLLKDEPGMAEDRGQNQQWSNKDMERLRVATRDFDDILSADGPEAIKQELIKKRIKTKPMAGPKGVLPEQGVAEGSTSHAELAQMAYDAYVAATRKGNGPMAAHYLKQHLKHKADAAKAKSGVAEGLVKGEYGRVLDALQLYYPRLSMEELNVPGYHKVVADKANVPVEYAARVINDFARDNDPDEDEFGDFNDDEQGVAEGEINTARMNKPHQDFYSKNAHFKRDDKEVVAQGGKLATKVSPSSTKQVSKKPATPFGKTVSEDASGGASGAGSVASVNNPGGKPKSQVGSLFGGTFQREGEDAKPAKKAKAKLSK